MNTPREIVQSIALYGHSDETLLTYVHTFAIDKDDKDLARLIQARVLRGLRLLEESRPDWFYAIDVLSLNIVDYGNCVLAQVYGSYTAGMEELFHNYSYDDIWGHNYGFNIPNDCPVEQVLYVRHYTENLWILLATKRLVTITLKGGGTIS
jgi:hypothetical protein